MRPVVRPATAEDIGAFYSARGATMPLTCTAMVGELDGEVIAVGGFAHIAGRLIAFYDMDEKAARFKITLVKAAKKMVAEMSAKQRVMYAKPDPGFPGAVRWIESLGFVEMPQRGLYQWKP